MSVEPAPLSTARRRAVLAGLAVLALAAVIFQATASSGGPGDRDEAEARAENPVAHAWFYRPPSNASERELAQDFDRYILTRYDEDSRERLRDEGVDGPFLQYLRFEAIMDDTGRGYTWGNQVAHLPGDWKRILRDHPDWFLRDAQGDLIPAGIGDESEELFYLMDPANPGWREFFLSRLRSMQSEYDWDGVFLDNVEGGFDKRDRTGPLPASYDEEEYRAATEDFLLFLQTEYFMPEGRPLEANLIEMPMYPDGLYDRYLQHLDGAMIEGWGVGWDRESYGGEEGWEADLALAEQAQSDGKHVWLVTQGERDDRERLRFAYGSYLLVVAGDATFRYTNAEAYDEVWHYPEYDLDLGAPLGPREQVAGEWERQFENGRVVVDPVAQKATVTTNG